MMILEIGKGITCCFSEKFLMSMIFFSLSFFWIKTIRKSSVKCSKSDHLKQVYKHQKRRRCDRKQASVAPTALFKYLVSFVVATKLSILFISNIRFPKSEIPNLKYLEILRKVRIHHSYLGIISNND